MHIIQIISELCPIAKVGGLADVTYGLSQELVKQGHRVELILPKYDCLQYAQLNHLKVGYSDLCSFEGTHQFNNTVWSAEFKGLNLWLIEAHHPQNYFNRGVIYGCPDDIDRFIYFSRTAMEFLFKSNQRPDIIHVHDWPTAIVPVLYKDMYQSLGYHVSGTVLTIHNVEHQGKCQPFNLARAGLNADRYCTLDQMQDPKTPNLVNLLKGGIEYADKITTVSPKYEQEILTSKAGFGLENALIRNRKKFKGILNGIDENFWNPNIDPYLFRKYSTYNIEKKELFKVLEAKRENKQLLKARLKIREKNTPLVTSISRLVPQKSPELIKHALLTTLKTGGQFILLGTTPILSIQQEFEKLQKDFIDHPDVAILLEKDEALAHQIFAAADLFIVPSLFEPCGLTQMIALRYATVPLVRSTGGLVDTVFDIDTSSRPFEERNGFTFNSPNAKELDQTLIRAFDCYKNETKKWQSLILHGMQRDFSWKYSANEYLSLFQEIKKSTENPIL